MPKKNSKLSSKVKVSTKGDFPQPKEGQLIGKVIKLLGGDRLLVTLSNGEEYIVRIPGKFIGQLLIRKNSYVLLRQTIPGNSDHLELIYRYNNEELECLRSNCLIEEW